MIVAWLVAFMVCAAGAAGNVYVYVAQDGGAVSIAAAIFCGALALWALVQSAVSS